MKASASQVTPSNSPGAQILQRKVASDHPEGSPRFPFGPCTTCRTRLRPHGAQPAGRPVSARWLSTAGLAGLAGLQRAVNDSTTVERFRSKAVQVPGSQCLWWTGAVSGRGHGRFYAG